MKNAFDKLICIVNSCKFISVLIKKENKKIFGADEFLPCLIYFILKSKIRNPY